MNQTNLIDSNLILNITFKEYLDLIGNYEIIDILYFYFISSICFIGSILNLICIWIFFNNGFTQPIYTYYKILSINSFVHEFFGIWFSLCLSPRYIPFEYSYQSTYYQSVFIPFHMFLHYYSGLIELTILLDRIKLFVKRVKRLFKLEPSTVLKLLFLISIILSIPGIFINQIKLNIWYSHENEPTLKEYKIYILGLNELTETTIGFIFILFTSFLFNALILLITIVLNLILVYLIRKYSRRMTDIGGILPSPTDNQLNINKRREKLNKRASLMAIMLTSISIVSRIMIVVGILSFKKEVNFTSKFLLALGNLFIFIDSSSLFIVCFYFNKIFKDCFLKLIKIRKNINNNTNQ